MLKLSTLSLLKKKSFGFNLKMSTFKSPHFTYITSSNGIDEFKLNSNDLRILLKKEGAAPVATVMITYHVGSRNEVRTHKEISLFMIFSF